MKEGLSITKISYEAGKRPEEVKRSGSGNYCCVPNCKSINTKYITRPRLKQEFFFSFSKNPQKRRKQWLQSISRFGRRGGGKDKFHVNNALIREINCKKT